MKLGFIVNPISGMGGRVGLKGTDGEEVLRQARDLGAKEESGIKARRSLEQLLDLRDKLVIYTYPGNMGEDISKDLGFDTLVLSGELESFGPHNTEAAALKMLDEKVDLIMFAGGDGTARNVYNAIDLNIPVIGIPAGVKIHSGVFAIDPKSAGTIAHEFLIGNMTSEPQEVMDIDEEAFRREIVNAKLYGYMTVPKDEDLVQFQKSGVMATEEDELDGIALRLIEDMEEDVVYIIGSGTSLRPIMEELGLDNSLLGVDLVLNKKQLIKDASEKEILEAIKGKKAKIFVTTIGGQGYVFGRGNQQISSDVIRAVGRDNITIISTKSKLLSLGDRPLLVDTGDQEVNAMFNGYVQVLIDHNRTFLQKIKGL